MADTLSIEQRVTLGAEWLDQHGPEGWADRIDLSSLDISSPCLCILGQVYGHWDRAPMRARWVAGSTLEDLSEYLADDRGFNGTVEDLSALNAGWGALILARREATKC